MRVIVPGDLHLSATPPGRRNETYLPELWEMLAEIGSIAKAENLPTVFVGDLFHHKRANRVPYWLVERLMEELSTWPTVVVIPGNHDLADGSIESLERQPLTMLDWLDNVTLLTDPAHVQWVHTAGNGGFKLRGIPGTAEVTEARDEVIPQFAGPCDLLVAHAPIAIRELPWKCWQPQDLPLDGVRHFVYGHQHDQAGIVGNLGAGTTVWSAGCLARGSIREADHTPAVLILDITGDTSEIRPLASALPSGDIYRWAEREAEIAENTAMASFIEALGAAQLKGFSKEALTEEIRTRPDLESLVKTMAVEILEAL